MKKRNLRSEKKWMTVFDFITILITTVLLSLVMVNFKNIGIKSFVASTALFAVGVFAFICLLDEYKIYVTELYEKTVIFVLSSIYTYIVIALIDIFVLDAARMVLIHLAYPVAVVFVLIAENLLINKIFSNPKIFEKPKLLILETDVNNFKRLKRMKYGSLKYYDSWYEILDPNNSASIDLLIQSKLDGFDAVCLLDKIDDDVYNRVVKAVTERNIDLYITPKLNEVAKSNSQLTQLDDVVAMYIPRYMIGTANELFKRITDIIVALVGLVIAVIPMVVISILIKITSPGPIFYKQIRYTKNKKEFEIYKFRTMVQDAEKLSGPVFAKKHDDRITSVGKILRLFRLDELPQLINILKGDMSVVGPRPERPFFVEQFEKELDGYNFRFAVKAGLTSLSHVYGRYSTYIYDRTCFDLLYITRYSYLLDLKILLLTSKIMFLKSAAEGEDEFKLTQYESVADTKEVVEK